MARGKVSSFIAALVFGLSIGVTVALYAGDGPRVGKPLGYSGARPSIGHANVGRPLGRIGDQRPLGQAAAQPLGGVSNRRPLGTLGSQAPLGSGRIQPPLGRLNTSQRPLGSAVNRHSLGYGRPAADGRRGRPDAPRRPVSQALNQMRLQADLRDNAAADDSIEPVDDVEVDRVKLTQEQIRLNADIESRLKMIAIMRDAQLRVIVARAQAGIGGLVGLIQSRANVAGSVAAARSRQQAVLEGTLSLQNLWEQVGLSAVLRDAHVSPFSLRPAVMGFGLQPVTEESEQE